MKEEQKKKYIVAVEFGSSRISMAAGYHDEKDNRFVVDAIETVESGGCVKRGRVINVADAEYKVSSLKKRLENRISPYKITQVYVGVGGQSIRSVEHRLVYPISSDIAIDETLLQEMAQEVGKRVLGNNLTVFDVVMGECRVDDRVTANPCGEYGSEIQVSYRLIVGNERHKRNLEKVFSNLKFSVAGYIVTAVATAKAAVSAEERRQGLAILDCGAETTTLSIFRDGYLSYLVTIPLGGKNITRDICDLHITENEAEELKRVYEPRRSEGLSLPEAWQQQGYILDIKPETLEEVIVARLGEIIANVTHQIDESRQKQFLNGGMTLVGGAALLKGLREQLKRETALDVIIGTVVDVSMPRGRGAGTIYAPIVGLLLSGDKECATCEVAQPQKQDTPQEGKSQIVSETQSVTETQSVPKDKSQRNPRAGISTLFEIAKGWVNDEDN
ncbi:MAG: rod shape-determining protein [Coprobacter sp.]|nr:rod shape-determining protein [Coprobacter sp.]